MFAGENYFYLDNITLTKDEAAAGCKKVVDVKGHFDEAVSAWQVKFTLPEGVTIDVATAGSDMTLTYQNQLTDPVTLDPYYAEATYTPNLSPNADKTNFIVSVMDTKEYDPSTGKSYGICWRPGDYEQMWRVRLVFPAGFKGGDIVLNTQQSCSQSIMPGLTGCTLNPIDKTTEVRIKADKPEIAVTGDDYTKTVTITAEEGATIYYSTNGVDYQVYSAPIEFNEEGTYKVYAYAEGPGEGVERKSKSDVAESDEFTIKKQETPAFEATADVTFNENVATLTYKANDPDAEVVVKVDGTPTTVTWTYNEETKAYTATYTVVKSDEPGEHSVTVELTVTPSENYTGEPASDSDTYTYKVNDELKGEIVFGEVDPETGLMPVSYNGTEDGVELTVTVNGVEVPVVDGKVQLAEGENEVTATASAEGYNDKEKTDNVTWTKPLPQAVKPKITFTPDNGGVNVKIEDYTEYTIKVNGTQVDPTRNEHNYYVEKGDVEKNIEVYAKNAPENMIPAETTATYKLAAKTVYNTPNPVIGEPTVNDDDVTFTVTGEGTVTVTVTNGDKTETYTGTGEVEVTIPRTDKDVTYTVNATAKSNKEGYDVITEGTASATVTVPALQTEKPTITYEYGKATWDADGNLVKDGRYATITITNNDEGENVVIEYSLDGGETWLTYNPEVPVTVSGEGTHTVKARAKAEGKALSEVESVDIKIDKATSVNELVNGKAVAGVRYFNMAGQEMQEANGITIVVTTYTDGTTSAVKVIK
jgi:predicted aspartyl protease